MTRLINIQTNQPVDVPANQVKQLINSKQFGIMPTDELELKTRTGLRIKKTGLDALNALRNDDIDLASEEELNKERVDSEYGDTLGEIGAFTAGALSSASFGASDYGIKMLADQGIIRPDTLKNLRDANPDAFLGGEILGVFSPTVAAPAKAAAELARGVKALAAAGKLKKASSGLSAIAKTAEAVAPSTLQKMFKAGATGAVDMYAYQAGRNISESAIEDKELTAEHVLVDPIEMVPFGFGLGAAMPLVSEGFKKLGRMETIKKSRETLTKAVNAAISRAKGKSLPEKILNALEIDKATKMLLNDRPAFTEEWIRENFSSPQLADEFINKYKNVIMTDEAKLENFSNYASLMFSKGEGLGTEGIAREISDNVTPIKGLADLQKRPTGKIVFPRKLDQEYSSVYGKNKLVKDAIGHQIGESISKIGSVYDELLAIAPNAEVGAAKLFDREMGNIKGQLTDKYSKELSSEGLKKFDDEITKLYGQDRYGELTKNREFLIKKDIEDTAKKLGVNPADPKYSKLMQKIKETSSYHIDRNISNVKQFIPTVNELYQLRSKLSELSSTSIVPKDKRVFYKMSDFIDSKIITSTTGQIDRIQEVVTDLIKRYKNPEILDKKLLELGFPQEFLEIVKESRGAGNKLDKKLLGQKIMDRYDLNDTFNKMLNDRAAYYNGEVLDEILSKIHDKSMGKGLTFKEWKNGIHLGISILNGPFVGGATFLIDQALDTPKAKLFMLEMLHGAEQKASKKIGTSAFNVYEKIKPLASRLGKAHKALYPVMANRDYDKNIEEVSKMVPVDENNIDQVFEANPLLAAEAPDFFTKYVETYNNAIQFLASKIPNMEQTINGENKEVSDLEKRRFNRYFNAVKDPYSVLANIANFNATPEEVEVLKMVFPAMFQTALEAFVELVPDINDKNMTYDERIFLSNTFGLNLTNSMIHENTMFLQNKYANGQSGLSTQQGTSNNNRTRKLGMTQYKGAINRNATSLQKIQGK